MDDPVPPQGQSEAQSQAELDPNRSGLKDPDRAGRSLAAMALSLEAMALLMAIIPMRILLDDATAATIAVLSLTVACIGLAGFSRRPWIWKAGAVIQVALIACWFIHWSLGAAGIVFALVWAFCWQTRNQLAKPPRR